MKKKANLLILIVFLLSLNMILAIDLKVTPNTVSNTYIIETDEPAIFDLTLENLGNTSNFEISSLVGIDITPNTPIRIYKDSEKTVRIELKPQPALKTPRKFFTFEYRIKNDQEQIQKEQLTINIIHLEEAFSINPPSISPESEFLILNIKNKLSKPFENVKIGAESAFFDYSTTLSFQPLETKEISIPINKNKSKTLGAGEYLVDLEFEVNNKNAKKEIILDFLEQEGIEYSREQEGILINKIEITNKNIGNVRREINVQIQKNLFSGLFTSLNKDPTRTEINGFNKIYTWNKELIPNETYVIIARTNWYIPLLVVLLVIILVILIIKYNSTDIILTKNVSFIKTKGGQFALRITLKVKAKKFIEKINILDKLPPLVNLYDKFGAIKPDRIDTERRRLEWNIDYLSKGESRILTYIIYSRIGVVGRFELPNANTSYEREGKVISKSSNRAFYINEPKQ
jgi:hypothetical protein